MKFLVILSCLLASSLAQYHAKSQYPQHIPVIGHNGVPVEPPEVVKARNEHLAALKAASAHSPSQGYNNQYNNYDDSHKYDNGEYKPELYENQQSYSGYSQPAYNKYQAPITTAPAHYAHTPSSYASTSFGPSHHFGGGFGGSHSAYSEPKIGHNGVPLDTPEVAAAKAAHFEAHSKAAGAAHNHYRYRRDIHEHATSTQNHNAHFGPHHVISVSGGHEHYTPEHSGLEEYSLGESHGFYRKRREAYGHATSYQNHNAHFGPHHEVPVYGHHHAAPLSHHELPHDTPEVEYAKHQHFAAHAALGHYIHRRDVYGHATSSQNHNAHFGPHHIVPVSGGHHYGYHGYSGHLQVPHDTPEVAAAKAEHFAAHAHATHGAHYGLTHGGVPHDTPEVAAAKHQHFAAHAAARGHHY